MAQQLSYIEQEYQKYVQLPGINFSMLKLYLKSPSTYLYENEKWKNKQKLITEDNYIKEKSHFILGKAVHNLTLQPDIFNKYYTVLDLSKKPSPSDDFRNAKNREWKKEMEAEFAAVSPEKTVLTSDEYNPVSAMATAIRKNKRARSLLSGSTVEMPISWVDEETGVACKGTPDIANRSKGFIADIKTIDDIGKLSVQKSVNRWKYYVQLPMYSLGLLANSYEYINGYYFIFVDKNPPHPVAVYSLSDYAVQMGIKVFRGLLAAHKECEAKALWPGYEIYGNDMGIIEISINDAEASYLENHPMLRNA